VAEKCQHEPLEVLSATGAHRAACHLDAVLQQGNETPGLVDDLDPRA
jgi:hypothetical protein